ncbi:MAG: AcrR family transcriptional regulator [Candidatus Azotimanducaceae bacterium]|jgi:AcrR family transcriptional regulator
MNDRNTILLKSAQAVFGRYGISKTTMNDIAREAGVARQTLYNAYPSKEAVLRATLRLGADQTIAAVEAKWVEQTSLSDKLDAYFELGPLYWHDLVQSSPEVADLIDGINLIAQDELIEIAKLWNARFETVIQAHISKDSAHYHNAVEIADYFYSTSMNAKYNSANRGVLETRLKVLKLSILALLEDSQSSE